MGFLIPSYKVSSPPQTPDPVPQEDFVENNSADALAEKRKKRKGLEATLLSKEHSQNTTSQSSLEGNTPSSESESKPTVSSVEMNRKTLG